MLEKFKNKSKLETAQILPIVVLMTFVIIGMVALLLDGGFIMSSRRTARAAADASALAGAKLLCNGESKNIVESEAENFATEINGASEAIAFVDEVLGEVTVTTTVEGASFFAKIFGEDSLSATGRAVAGCYPPSSAKRLLPIAFYWETPPIERKDADCSDPNDPCTLVSWDLKELMDTLKDADANDLPLEKIYVIADSTKICEKATGEIVCYEMKHSDGGGNRTWIELDVLVDGNLNVKNIIKEGIDEVLRMPAWLEGLDGLRAAVFNADNYSQLDPVPGYEDSSARLVFVPVFDEFCPKSFNFGIDCYNVNKRNDPKLVNVDDNIYIDRFNTIADADKVNSYRLRGIAPFVITCVTKGGDCEYGECITDPDKPNKSVCPGYINSNPTGNVAIEGYFVGPIISDEYTSGTGGVPVGTYTISLTE